jgi:hypothetical protein
MAQVLAVTRNAGVIGLSEKSAARLIEEHGELDVQRHAMYCLWMMDRGKVHIPPAWLTASLKGDWSAPHGMPSGPASSRRAASDIGGRASDASMRI